MLFNLLVIGYILSLWTTILGAGLNYTIFDFPNIIPTWLLCYPAFNITRILYHLTYKCGYGDCLESINKLPDELITCIVILYISSIVYLFLGIYLYEVLPQQFGVRKHPCFCVKSFMKKIKRSFYKNKAKIKIEDHINQHLNNDNSNSSTDVENNTTDAEIQKEIRKINELVKNYVENLDLYGNVSSSSLGEDFKEISKFSS